jgi:hypothetical protein
MKTHLVLSILLGHGFFLRLSFALVSVVLEPDFDLKAERQTRF